jgi:hypothetical protein
MSAIQIDAKDPEYYAELLIKTSRLANRRIPSDERPCSTIPGIQNVDDPLARRLQSLLDALADISLRQRGNVSATMASLKDNGGTLETTLYIVFNNEDDEAARRCPKHLETIFSMLSKVPYTPPATGGSPKVISNSLEFQLVDFCTVIHNYSFDIFAHRVTKRQHKLPDIRGYIEQDRTQFTPQDRSSLLVFLRHVDMIINDVNNAMAIKRFFALKIRMLLNIYAYWTGHDLLPKDGLTANKLTLLDKADTWLANGAWSPT